jgi:hypothetical protein
MKQHKKMVYFGLVIFTVALMCLQAGAINTTKQTIEKNNMTQTITSFGGNTLVSVDNPDGDDIHPRLCQGPGGVVVVVYEQEFGIFSKNIPIVWSDDGGETWTTQFVFDSIEFTAGSGILQWPDLVYSSTVDQYYLAMVDPLADMYNNEMAFIPGDITTAEEASWYGVSGSGSENYNFCAAGTTGNFFLSLTTEDGYGMEQLFGLCYTTYPDFENPPTMGGFYYDGNSEHQSAPSTDLEMDVGGNRIYIVTETEGQITVKSTSSDESMLTNGEMQNGMDKYADIEQYPGEYIGAGADPDVSSSGNKVCVVYVQDGDVKCGYSTNDAGTYDPGHNWQVSTVATGASAPAVFMSGNTVLCAYVQGGNLYSITSEDGGATWGAPAQVNEEDGTVVDEHGSVDIIGTAIAWTDNRNGAKDIYSSGGAASLPEIGIKSISKGMGVSAVIENTGAADAEDVAWSIIIDAPLMILGGETSGTIDVVPVGGEVTIKSGFVLGFGPAAITVTAGDASGSEEGTVLLIFIL